MAKRKFVEPSEVIHTLFCVIEDIGYALQEKNYVKAFELVEREMGEWCTHCNVFGCHKHGGN